MKGQNALGFTLMDLRKDLQSNYGSLSAAVSIPSIEVRDSEPSTPAPAPGSDHQPRVPVHIPIDHPTENIHPSPKSVDCGSETIIVHADVHRSAMIETPPSTEIIREPATAQYNTPLDMCSNIPLPEGDSLSENTPSPKSVSTSKPDANSRESTSGASQTVSVQQKSTYTRIVMSNKPVIRVKSSIPRRRSNGSISSTSIISPGKGTLHSFFNAIAAVKRKVSPEKSSHDNSNKKQLRH